MNVMPRETIPPPHTRTVSPAQELAGRAAEAAARAMAQGRTLAEVVRHHAARLMPALASAMPPYRTEPALEARSPAQLASDLQDYAIDSAQRAILFWDIMREAGNAFVAHEAEGCPPVLVFRYETLLDGRTLPRPVNYALVRILPDPGMPETDPRLRPFVIIDPRAGHGAGIGGFKSDSQVGVALRRGHPVYFVIFYRDPVEGQTILDVTAAEAVFVRHVVDRHPGAPKPVVIGNCQGGWATMMLGAAAPDHVGALVLNGAPLSYWAGERGKNPMRYLGGLAGGSWPAAMLADLGNGRFDGANLVLNFEALSPGSTWFRKYFDVYANADTERERFLEFERWWGGFFLMNRDEIRWIVSNLFIGNRFSTGQLSAGRGHTFNIRNVRAPVIVFASSGDNITPPGQALAWIADIYLDEREIRGRGQTIVYLLHDQVGHLGIFVSGKVARKEHAEIATTLEMIEAVAPGLYEMRITGTEGRGAATEWQVELVERTIEDVRRLCGDAGSEEFPAVAKMSALNETAYDVLVAPFIRAVATETSAEARRAMHPLRLRRTLVSDRNPAFAAVAGLSGAVRANRRKAAPDNAFLALERAWAGHVERAIDLWRDWRDAMMEITFHAVYGALATAGVAGSADNEDADAARSEIASRTPLLEAAAQRVAEGGYAEAVIRMMILLAEARGGVRRSRLARSNALLTGEPPFAAMSPAERQAIIRDQTAVVTVDREAAIAALPVLLPDPSDRGRALAAVEGVAGPEEELGEGARAMLGRLRAVLGLAAPREPAVGEAGEAAA
jgi:pimeloyl-ACP methyl ester carboxylesterase